MTSLISALLFAMLAGTCYAQTAQQSFRDHIANLVLAEQSAIDSDIECGRYYDDVIPKAIGLRIFSNYTPETCHNIATLFDPQEYQSDDPVAINDNGNLTDSCDPFYRNCTRDYQVNGIDNYSSSANYSQIQIDFYYVNYLRDYEQLELRLFPGEDCRDDAAEPWFSWGGCDEDGPVNYCRELPYSVGSFQLQRAARGEDRECRIAAERGGGMGRDQAGLGMVFLGVLVAGVMALM